VLVLTRAGGQWLDATVVSVCDAADADDAAVVAAATTPTKDAAAAGGHGSNGDLPQGVNQERQAGDSSATAAAAGGGGSEEAEEAVEEQRDAASAGSSQAEHSADSPPPPDWAQSVSRSTGEVYHTHTPAGESQWERPRSGASGVAPLEDSSAAAAAAADEPAQPRKRVATLQYAEPIGSAYRSQGRTLGERVTIDSKTIRRRPPTGLEPLVALVRKLHRFYESVPLSEQAGRARMGVRVADVQPAWLGAWFNERLPDALTAVASLETLSLPALSAFVLGPLRQGPSVIIPSSFLFICRTTV
jgi:hypothetical protein